MVILFFVELKMEKMIMAMIVMINDDKVDVDGDLSQPTTLR